MATTAQALGLLLAACCCALPGAAMAGDETAAQSPLAATANQAELERFSQLLDSEQFSERRLASQELAAAGVRALPVLEKAALGDNREATARAMSIMQQHFVTGDDATRREAEAFLKRIATSNNAFAARRAEEVLHPADVTGDQFQPLFGGAMVPIRGNVRPVQVAQVQGRVRIAAAKPAQVKQVRVQIVNGQKAITVTENDRTIRISEKKDSIEVEVTEENDGKQTTEKFSAKDADELKTKHPEAYKLYKRHNGGGIKFGAQIQIRAGNAQ